MWKDHYRGGPLPSGRRVSSLRQWGRRAHTSSGHTGRTRGTNPSASKQSSRGCVNPAGLLVEVIMSMSLMVLTAAFIHAKIIRLQNQLKSSRIKSTKMAKILISTNYLASEYSNCNHNLCIRQAHLRTSSWSGYECKQNATSQGLKGGLGQSGDLQKDTSGNWKACNT